jgi:hypothetical protein
LINLHLQFVELLNLFLSNYKFESWSFWPCLIPSSQLQMKNVSTLSISTLQKNSNSALVLNLDHVYYLHFCFKDLRLSWNYNSQNVFSFESVSNRMSSWYFFILVKVCLNLKTFFQLVLISCLSFGHKPKAKVAT